MPERFGEDESGLLIAGPVRPGEKGVLLCGYIGPSMNPTLFEGDVLEILPYQGRSSCLGDIVFFRNPSGNGYIVHRIAAVSQSGVMTRGDNNSQADPYLLRSGDVIGKVVAARRRNRRRIIRGGWRGHLRGRLLIAYRPVHRSVARVLHQSYHGFAASGVALKFLPKAWRPRCVESDSPGSPRLHLVFLGKVVGHFDRQKGIWSIRRPYRIFVKEAALPTLSRHKIEKGS